MSSPTVNTLIFSGAGYFGILYMGIIRYLEDNNLVNDIKTIYGVSAGSLFGLLFSLGYTSEECRIMFRTTIDLSKLLAVQGRDILHMGQTYGASNGHYLEQSIKHLIENKGHNPYMTVEDFYKLTGIDFKIGVSLMVQERYELISHNNRGDMPLWLAIRMSCTIPLLLTPVKDEGYGDFICDGGILCNTPISYYLNDIYPEPARHSVATQTEDPPEGETAIAMQEDPPRYAIGCLCVNILNNNLPEIPIDQYSFVDYINAIIKKLFYYQDCMNPTYHPYMLNIDCKKYNFMTSITYNITEEQVDYVVQDGYNATAEYMRTITRS